MNPAGTILMYAGAGASAPTGYLLCDGTTYQVSTYPDLAAVIGATGASFSVPDLTGNTAPKGPIAADGKLDIDGSTNESVADFLTFNGTNNYIIKT